MEEGLSLLQKLKEVFQYQEVDIKTYSPLTLAYIGDSVYDLIIKTTVVERGNRAASSLHKASTQYVNANTQARMMEQIQDILTEEEKAVCRRGRNAKSYTSAKNASINDYRKATGFEALLGYLYLQGQMDRVIEIIKIGLDKIDMDI